MVWWKWVTIVWGIKQIFKRKEVRKLLKEGIVDGLYLAAWILDNPFVDYKWPIEKYQPAFRKVDKYRMDGVFTAKEIGGVLKEFGNGQPKLVKLALYAVGGVLEALDFEWDVAKYGPAFDELNVMRADNFFEDEEHAKFLRILAGILKE